jgi:hypothetical protein
MKPFTSIAVAFLAAIAVVYLFRLVASWEVVVAGFVIPVWFSLPALLIARGLAVMVWREAHRPPRSAPVSSLRPMSIDLASALPSLLPRAIAWAQGVANAVLASGISLEPAALALARRVPLWSTHQLAGSPTEEMTYAFAWVILPIVAMPWAYAFRTYVWPSKKNG